MRGLLVETDVIAAQSGVTEPGGRELSRLERPGRSVNGGLIMETHSLQALSIPSFVHDAPVVAGVGFVLIAGLAFITLSVLLPGLRTARSGPQTDQRGAFREFGPSAASLISDPVLPRAASPEADLEPQHVARPHRWPDVSESAVSHPASVRAVMAWTVGR